MASPPLAHREPGALGLSAGLGAAAVGMVAAWLSLPLALGLAGVLGLGLGLWAKRRADLRGARLQELSARAMKEVEGKALSAEGSPTRQIDEAISALTMSLAQQRRHLRRHRDVEAAILKSSFGGLVVVDRRLQVRAINPVVRQLLPAVPDPVGRPIIEAVPYAPLAQVLEEAISKGEPVEQEQISGRFDLLIRAVPLGEAGGAIAVLLDITTARRAERSRSDFVANVSHELRTPVTSIIGYAETLLDDPDALPGDSREMVDAIHRNATRLFRIFDDLLQLARIEARQKDMPLTRIALAELVEDAVDLHMDAAEAREVELSVELPPGLSARVNREAFAHILGNLVENGVKYTQSGGRVKVSAHSEGDRVILEVDDNGPGIDPVHHARIFERFYRVDVGRSRAAGGTGLGLSIVKHLCLATHAKISVRSLPGRGSTFVLSLPT
ncbi:ATP-binding protein [Myxococcota bacterium]|nr:ATP-binding protein [Myxococcota bacterium]